MTFMEALAGAMGQPGKYITNARMVSERHCYVRPRGPDQALKLVNFQTGLEQDWVPSLADLTSLTWQILEE